MDLTTILEEKLKQEEDMPRLTPLVQEDEKALVSETILIKKGKKNGNVCRKTFRYFYINSCNKELLYLHKKKIFIIL